MRQAAATLVHPNRVVILVLLAAAALVVGLQFLPGTQAAGETDGHPEPALVEHVEGTDLSRVTLSPRAAERLGIRTAPVRAAESRAQRTTVPYSALLYGVDGQTWVYTTPEALVFVRERVEVDRIQGSRAVLSDGPALGTAVATVGAAELLGTELGVDH